MLLKETTILATGSQDNECPTVGVTAEDAVSLARGIGKYKALADEAASLRGGKAKMTWLTPWRTRPGGR